MSEGEVQLVATVINSSFFKVSSSEGTNFEPQGTSLGGSFLSFGKSGGWIRRRTIQIVYSTHLPRPTLVPEKSFHVEWC